MSIGPVYECPPDLVAKMPTLASSIGIRVEPQNKIAAKGHDHYLFKSRIGRIVGRKSCEDGIDRIWLYFPKEHGLNPLYWFADFRLSRKIERMLRENGARSCDWSDAFPD